MRRWRVFITPAAERVAKKLPRQVQNFISEEFPKLVKDNPLIGGELSGPLVWLRSFHFSVDSRPYRIVYELKEKDSKIVIHYAGYRGGFYERLRRLF